ncbi:MAG TPA: hypothetical protein PK095_09835 [Myxococcota bacterium]|nr:hypothetical protein [Myxococcota bacterium]
MPRLAVLGLVLAACGTAPAIQRAPTYEELVQARIEASRSQATFALRHNPSDCACSPFEIEVGRVEADGQEPRVGGAWHRVELIGLDDNDPIVLRIRDHIARVEASGMPDRRVFAMEGRLEGRVGTCARGTAQLSFAPSALIDEAGPGDASPDE